MSAVNIVYPDVGGPQRLLYEIGTFFLDFACVDKVFGFGSWSRGQWDRWSDIDILLIVKGEVSHYGRLFTALSEFKPILYHGTLTPYVEPAGGNLLGIVFRDESVFHWLDLNFLTHEDYRVQANLERFGPLRELASTNASPNGSLPPAVDYPRQMLSADELVVEQSIFSQLFWTRKAVKKASAPGP